MLETPEYKTNPSLCVCITGGNRRKGEKLYSRRNLTTVEKYKTSMSFEIEYSIKASLSRFSGYLNDMANSTLSLDGKQEVKSNASYELRSPELKLNRLIKYLPFPSDANILRAIGEIKFSVSVP